MSKKSEKRLLDAISEIITPVETGVQRVFIGKCDILVLKGVINSGYLDKLRDKLKEKCGFKVPVFVLPGDEGALIGVISTKEESNDK